MRKIYELSSHVADLIAAGEVVERPGSVVKELLENAVDAGASAVTAEIENGGMSYIRITDNGCGIGSQDVETAFLRHATSKIREEGDLAAIGTLGFRGEALAAIAAVSRVELLTRTAEEEAGTAFSLEGGVPGEKSTAGCPEGTTIVVRNLFYNTPARLKFMKKDTAESANVFSVVRSMALAHPEVSFRLLRDGREELHTPGDSQLISAVYSALGRNFALNLLAVDSACEDIRVRGFVTKPVSGHGTRGNQHFFVNGRYIKSRLLTAALEEAYKNQMMVGKFPGCVLHLDIRPDAVDVNVHPAKTEVKFVNERRIFDAAYTSVLHTLEADREAPALREREVRGPRTVSEPEYVQQELEGVPAAPAFSPAELQTGTRAFHTAVPPADSELKGDSRPLGEGNYASYRGGAADFYSVPATGGFPLRAASPPQDVKLVLTGTEIAADAVQPVTAPLPSTPEITAEDCVPGRFRVLGEALATYVIVEVTDGVLLIDKHAAHERMIFDRLRANPASVMAQRLLVPVVAELPREESAALLGNLPLLEEFGFEAEDFGGGSLIVRQAPGDIAAEEISSTLSELAGKLLAAGRTDPAARRDEVLHTVACKAAIKAGSRSSPEELRVLAEQVVSGRVKYCPHGRPVAIFLSRSQLEKQFKRA